MNNDLEKWFKEDFINDPNSFLKHCQVIGSEVCLYRAMDVLKVNSDIFNDKKEHYFGRIDLIIKYRSQFYGVEVKYQPYALSDFWNALKIVGYVAYYNWQVEMTFPDSRLRPAVFIPLDKITLEHKIIANKLHLALFGIKCRRQKFSVIPINL